MKEFFANTFGGLKTEYLIRQYIFGICLGLFFMYLKTQNGNELDFSTAFMLLISTLLYPYSRFVYESAIQFILGENTFFVNGFIMIFVKAITMFICWAAAIFIAPIGLAYLYFKGNQTAS
ncbi:hypothetical protein A9Q74_16260 [Colwellia sp. 39_35_sub15_T18]|nr:hypothetical protein A9Q74_16260 [Colwellia sp. 39_35_sub15_T18]